MTSEHRELLAANEANWDGRVKAHLGSAGYDLEGFRAGRERLADFEYAELGELAGRDLVHLQCHLGTDTAYLARAGAKTVGLDFSAASVEQAAVLAAEVGAEIEYVRADVYDAVSALGGRTFDVVYTGKGSLCWLPDLDRWAQVVAELLRPGGLLYLVEIHPLYYAAADEQPGAGVTLDWDYLPNGAHLVESEVSYAGNQSVTGPTTSYEWSHGLGDVVNALLAAGLRLESLTEHDTTFWARWPRMHPVGNGWFRLPEGAPHLPLTFSLRARRP